MHTHGSAVLAGKPPGSSRGPATPGPGRGRAPVVPRNIGTVTAIPTSGVGSWPGTDIGEAVRQAFDLATIPYLPELPARGPGADLIGRTLGLLDGLAFDLSPTGWRVVDRPGAHQRRARARLRDDLDVLAERAESYEGRLKVAMCGWWTVATSVDLARGGRMLGDHGAVRDLVQAGRAAAVQLVAEVVRRVPGADVTLQIDEPGLPAALAGGVPTESGLSRIRPAEPETVSRSFAGLPGTTLVHSCARDVPVALLRGAGVANLSLDGGLVGAQGWDAVAEHLDAGGTLWLGLLPTTTPKVPSADGLVTRALGWLRPLELGPALVDRLVLTPACGLSGFSVRDAVRASETLNRAADLLTQELGRH